MRLVLLLSMLAACGGKIMPGTELDPGGGVGTGTAPAGGSTQSQPTDPHSPAGVTDPSLACAMVCDRNGRCGAEQPDCLEGCLADLRGACAAQTATYETCFASRLVANECAGLPPDCEQAWCDWARCTGQKLVSYCK